MLVEGKGTISPTPISVPLSRTELRLLHDEANKRNAFRGYGRRTDAWGRGFIKNPILVGLVGEHALCRWLSRRGFPAFVDVQLRPLGDGGRDVEVAGLVVQVKTRRKGIGKRSLIKRGDQRGHIVPLSADVFVFAQWNEETPQEPAKLLGWIWSVDLSRGGLFERSPLDSASHWNLKITDSCLLPMSRLADELVSRRECA